jgi:Zn-dependent protease with chaperone function
MNSGAKAILLISLAGVLVLPLATMHTLAPLLVRPSDHGVNTITTHPDIAVLVLLVIASMLPVFRVIRLLLHQHRSLSGLAVEAAAGAACARDGIRFVRVPGEAVAVFAAGIRRPAIYVTAGAEQLLAPEALRAALLHEQAHIRRHDVRWLAVVAAIEHAFSVLPWTQTACDAFRLAVERRADEDALRAGAGRLHLFDAIARAAVQPVPGAGLSAVGVEQRLRWLAEGAHGTDPDLARPSTSLLGSVVALPATAHLLVWLGVVCVTCWSHIA